MPDVTAAEMLFDTHAHVLSDDTTRYPYGALRGGARAPVTPLVFTVEDLIRTMDEGGIAYACLVQRATLYGYDNRYCLDAAEAHPDRFVPIVVLDAQDPGSPAKLRELAATRRIGGLRIVAPELTRDQTAWLDDDQAIELWRAAADLGLPVTIILYRLNNEAGRAALLGVARRFTSLPILIDHVGMPHASTVEKRVAAAQGTIYEVPPPPGFGVAEHLAEFTDLGHVRFKVTDINFDRLEEEGFDSAAFVRVLADRFGADRLLWGSDVGQSPAPYAEKVERLHASARLLSADERAAYFGGVAFGLYGGALSRG